MYLDKEPPAKSTYQTDYITPQTNRYDFLLNSDRIPSECVIAPEDADILKSNNLCKNADWVDPAPSTCLVKPRIIPLQFNEHQLNIDKEDNSNDLLVTTYQVDYNGMKGFPDPMYKHVMQTNVFKDINSTKRTIEVCNEFDAIAEDYKYGVKTEIPFLTNVCIKENSPFNVPFRCGKQLIQKGDYSHWRISLLPKRNTFPQYLKAISRFGCFTDRTRLEEFNRCGRKPIDPDELLY
ncbi:uncharacterized protein LOC119676044 [Teleopsis dalmanni]|uniref:uncharacterized protein LOC119676043 n=1 Tax=Teleopsis dalmanni TaxID=139649 RepID=UPI0018CD3919|nr:uncharacterized protein LOC119676043 [Teleopsis dalmanni]XP_037943194.1 uncharacterized protein LOC119676044 [Teleopsis dalmanni]